MPQNLTNRTTLAALIARLNRKIADERGLRDALPPGRADRVIHDFAIQPLQQQVRIFEKSLQQLTD